jgi:hypothetical protein
MTTDAADINQARQRIEAGYLLRHYCAARAPEALSAKGYWRSRAKYPYQIDRAGDKRGQPAIERPQDESRTHLIVYSNTQSEEACNHDYYDHDADDVENVHCALLLRYARTSV